MSRSLSARQADHLVGDIDAVDLREVAAEGAHQTARSAADFESLQRRAGRRRRLQLASQAA